MIKQIHIGKVNGETLKTSHTELTTYRRCRSKYNYRYLQELQKVTPALPLAKGKAIHSCLESLYLTGDWTPAYKKFKKEFDKLFSEIKEQYGDLPGEVYRIMRGYADCYKSDLKKWKVLGVEVPFVVVISKKHNIAIDGVIDLIIEDENGLIWVVEHKTASSMPNEDFRFLELQSAMYMLVATAYFKKKGRKVAGIIWNYLMTSPPKEPELLKSGNLSKAKIKTDRFTYLDTIKKHGLSITDYEDVLSRLGYDDFFKRIKARKPSTLVKNLLTEALYTGEEIKAYRAGNLLEFRNFSRQCSWDCEFLPICGADINGEDSSLIKRREFETYAKDKKAR